MNGYEKCKVNPENPGFVEKFEALHPDFQEDLFLGSVPKEQIYKYIVLTYDIESPFVIAFKDWAQRRRRTGKECGFEKENIEFSDEAEKIILGKNKRVNQFILRYLFLQNDIDFMRYQAYQNMYYKQIKDSMEADYDNPGHYDKLKSNIDILSKEMKSLQGTIFHGDETKDLKMALYDFISKINMDFKPEDRAERIEKDEEVVDENPYPRSYIPDEMRFIGDA